MKTSTKIWIGVAVVALILVMWVWSGYNNFITLDQNVQKSWSQVENQYQTQADKINLLIPVLKSSVSVETKFVKDVIEARTAYGSAATQLAKDTAGQQMNSGISAMVSAVAESYPTLQANSQYKQIMDELAGAQNRIATERGRYIESIQQMNTAVLRFPGNIIAGIFGFKAVEYYNAEAGATTPDLGTPTLP